MKNPYSIITKASPFLYITAQNADLASIVTTGTTELKVFRVTRTNDINEDGTDSFVPSDAVSYLPLEQQSNQFTFVLDDAIFILGGGRYVGALYYKGTYLESTYFVYSEKEINLKVAANA